MKLIIVSGLSGSGKSTVLHVLEDLRYYAIDNLPVSLLASFAAQMIETPEKFYQFAAIGIDARNHPDDLRRFPALLKGLRDAGIHCEVLFLDADDNILIKRFSETRRKHPLSNEQVSLAEAIELERQLLDPISSQADLYLDTSHSNLHQLRSLIRERVAGKNTTGISLLFQSFGYKHGVPVDADIVFDIRCLPNPYWETHLRALTGLDQPVQAFLQSQPMVEEMFQDIRNYLETWIPRFEAVSRTYLTIAIGCTGGQHRSVYLVERLAAQFRPHHEVITRHREL